MTKWICFCRRACSLCRRLQGSEAFGRDERKKLYIANETVQITEQCFGVGSLRYRGGYLYPYFGIHGQFLGLW